MIDDMELMMLRQQEELEAARDAAHSAPRAQADDFLDARPVEDDNKVSGAHDTGTFACLHRPFSDNMAVLCMGIWGVPRYRSDLIRGAPELIPDLLEVWDLVAYFAGVLKCPATICGANFWTFCQRLEHPRAQLFHWY